MKPDFELEAKQTSEEQSRLSTAKSQMSEDQILNVIEMTKKLKGF